MEEQELEEIVEELEDIVEEEEKKCIISFILFCKFIWHCRKFFICK